MEDINLHFTGDFHAVCAANNLLAAMLDNHIHHGNKLRIDTRRVTWKRVIDLNDRSLRNITIGLGGPAHGQPREDGFDIAAASEVMAILCLAESLNELRERFGQIIVGYNFDREPVFARDLDAHGAMTVLMKDAIKPNLVQTLEGTPALIHGGPFANIAHGCNSVIATKLALKLADYVVTEAGFGADLGAEKFINIKCRKANLRPDAVVLVATIRALKYQGGGDDMTALGGGLENLRRHAAIIRDVFGLPLVVTLNRFTADTEEELTLVKDAITEEAPFCVADHWARGGDGATDLANALLSLTDGSPSAELSYTYEDSDPLWSKINHVAKKVYGASEVTGDKRVREKIKRLQDGGYGAYPVCIVKTQFSFTTDPKFRGAIDGHVFHVRDVYVANGAEFLVVLTGDIMTMPGLPRHPAAEGIDIDAKGEITGLI
jgi:formate--tetrahydrofolate ligase